MIFSNLRAVTLWVNGLGIRVSSDSWYSWPSVKDLWHRTSPSSIDDFHESQSGNFIRGQLQQPKLIGSWRTRGWICTSLWPTTSTSQTDKILRVPQQMYIKSEAKPMCWECLYHISSRWSSKALGYEKREDTTLCSQKIHIRVVSWSEDFRSQLERWFSNFERRLR